MTKSLHVRTTFACLAVASILGLLLLSSCGKKQTTEVIQPPPPDTSAVPATASAEAQPAAPAPAPTPIVDDKASIAEADAAMKKADYERAAAQLLAIQAQQRLSEQQAQAV